MTDYVNRAAYQSKKTGEISSIQIGARIPLDLVGAMDEACRARGVRRNVLVVAALRAHLNKPDPASVPARAKGRKR